MKLSCHDRITRAIMYFHRNIRLAAVNYTGKRAYFVTQCCHERRRHFSGSGRCEWLLSQILSISAANSFAIPAYCIIPDHLHLLVEGLSATADFLNFMKSLKIKTSREFAINNDTPLWQKKYFDHILRPRESMDAVAWYIWLNPVRARLERAPGLYPFAGSFTTEIPTCSSWPDFWVPPYKIKRGPPQKAAATNSSAPHD